MASQRKRSPPAERGDALCGCDASATGTGGQAVAVDPEVKTAAVTRLRRIEGQVRGLQRMVDDERYCPEILTQMASVQEALRAVARTLMRNHLKHCIATAHGRSDSERVYNELLELIFRQSR